MIYAMQECVECKRIKPVYVPNGRCFSCNIGSSLPRGMKRNEYV